jgi:hypothetical protein
MEMRQGRPGGKVDKEEDPKTIKTHEDLIIYQKAFDAAMTIFEVSKGFPIEERYSLTDQIRRSGKCRVREFGRSLEKEEVSGIICR